MIKVFDYIINGNSHTIDNFPSMVSHFLGEKHNKTSLIYYYHRTLFLKTADFMNFVFFRKSQNLFENNY